MKENTPLNKLFEQYAHARNHATAFTELLDFFLISFKWYETGDEQRQALEQLQQHPYRKAIIPLLTEIGECSEGFTDALGDVYEQYVSKGRNGQFFTPDPIATLLTTLSLLSNPQPGHTVLDPACGSGRLLLATAKMNRHLIFYGADVDEVCCKMSVVNMLLNSLTGEIAHIDTLANTFYKGYKVATKLYNGHHHPYYIEFTDPERSEIWLRPVSGIEKVKLEKSEQPHQGVQGTLF